MPEWLTRLFIPPHIDEINEADPKEQRKLRNQLRRWSLLISIVALLSLAHILIACGLLPGIGGFALARDVDQSNQTLSASLEKLREEVRAGKNNQRFEAIQSEIRRLEQAAFDVESRINDLRSRGQEPDAFYYDRLRDLRSDKNAAERRLSAFLRSHPDAGNGE